MSTPKQPTNTTAFFVQAGVSFGLALLSLLTGIEVDPWVRAFLGLAVVFLTTSAFTLGKCVRDQQETAALSQRPGSRRQDPRRARSVPEPRLTFGSRRALGA